MSELYPLPLPSLVRRLRAEIQTRGAAFDLPVRKWHIPDPELDLSAVHFSRPASTPVGPAAGPHTQLAQNIVLAWLGGGRIIEIKTVQIDDRLRIPRPCIHVPNIGYNVEWSQELRIEESLREYAKAAYLIEILKSTRAFGRFPEEAAGGFDTVFDISVGYDLAGIRSDRVTGFIEALKAPAAVFDELRADMTDDLAAFRDLPLPEKISDTVTLSTFHGCPADQIESIARYLLEDLGLHTIIKLNPTLLGFERVRELLVERLGYEHLRLRREAFEVDLQYEDGLEILRRLRGVAAGLGSIVGAKFTNTLVVENDPAIFPTQEDPYMYVSGPPLHVISMTLMQRFREDLGFEFPVSFSAGIDVRNFPAAVACGMVPVTTCTDLLRQGGYGRLPGYLRALGSEMRKAGVRSREAYVLAARGHGAEAVLETLATVSGAEGIGGKGAERLAALADADPDGLPLALRAAAAAAGLDGDALVLHATRVAGRLNGRDIVPPLVDERRYQAAANAKTPRRIESTLALYDCINCDLCISACPNDAIFAYEAEPVAVETEVLTYGADGRLRRSPGAGFEIEASHQLAVVEGGCNECSNCEVYCPEEGAPFRVKERLFLSREAFDASGEDGFLREERVLHGRFGGRLLRFEPQADGHGGRVRVDGLTLSLAWDPFTVSAVEDGDVPPGGARGVGTDGATREDPEPLALDTALLWRLRTAWESIYVNGPPSFLAPEPADGRAS
ncbi:MAG: 4Fe-4S binding protein [Gemmatimonadota bacterium]